jgi:hypothetical protein
VRVDELLDKYMDDEGNVPAVRSWPELEKVMEEDLLTLTESIAVSQSVLNAVLLICYIPPMPICRVRSTSSPIKRILTGVETTDRGG